ncbi:MAG TPA: carboxypeptidase-like regulatory domain-containing protein, partial [Candidatus Goldiibacteriota bacterium]|nr:carboxypeptidase-like regulatory domain-containing protein [Candidatus Goldiibacteriota bacterium]
RKNRLVNEIVSTDSPRGIDYIGGMLYVAVMNGVDMFETGKYEKPASSGFDYPVYGVAAGKSPSGPRAYVAGFNKGEKTGKIAVIDASENEVIEEFDLAGSPMYLEIKKDRPTTAPTKAATAMPTDTPVPAATATPEPTATPVPKAAKKAAKKPAKKPAPEPTVNPGLTSALSGRVFMDNSPVANVRIKALSKHSDRVYRTTTDEAGRFVFEALPIGGYVISVEATYIKETALAVTVNKGKNPAITINVKKR